MTAPVGDIARLTQKLEDLRDELSAMQAAHWLARERR
jgi:hypothetical protein